MMYIGLACSYHDPAIAIVDSEGEIIFAEATERPLQNKRAFHCVPDFFPYIDSILDRFCCTEDDLVIAKSWGQGANYWRRLSHVLNIITGQGRLAAGHESADARRNRFLAMTQFSNISFSGESLRHRYSLRYPNRRISGAYHDHHLTHAAAACFASPFDDAVCAVIDGFGDESSTAFYRYSNGIILPIAPDRISRNSLGHFYNRVCISCGYDPDKGDHWRLMGLAPTGSANRALLDALRGTLTVRGLEIAGREQMRSCPVWDRPGDYPQADIARAGQEVFEEVMTELLGNLCSLELSENLILTGGCALNSTYNGKVLAVTGFSELHIPPAPADDGNAIGAALLSYIADGGRVPRRAWQSPYLGSTLSGNSLSALAQNAREGSVRVVESGVERVAAKALAEGKIIGWVQGAAEFGPRALGNRSILANPGQADMAERIRATVKEREAFRPFAPAILHEHGDAYFCEYQASPYMERTLRYRSVAAGRVPAVVHVDNTGRVQSVKREWNPSFHRLIDEFYKETNIPIVLNTSLNISGKPIVHSLEDAIGMLFTTGLDAIILENYYIEK